MITVGLLALQGAFLDHRSIFRDLGCRVREVRTAADLDPCDALVIPGGESTVMDRFLRSEGLVEIIRRRTDAGMPLWGICAGAVILSKSVDGGPGCLGLLDLTVRRNAYGRQNASEKSPLDLGIPGGGAFPGVFIRAPRIIDAGASEILGVWNGDPVMVRSGGILATTFHPELTDDDTVHRYFLSMMNPG